jgi:oligopeptide/dipeptide ABC transporter ATP-binding protein
MSAPSPLLTARNVTVRLRTRRGWLTAVDDASVELAPGASHGLVGESGSGKSVLLKAILGLLPQDAEVEGEMTFAGEVLDLSGVHRRTPSQRRDLAVIFQDPMTALNPVQRIGAQVAEGPRVHLGMSRAAGRERAVALLEEVGITDPGAVARRYPHELSGGMRQRALIASALACDPKLILCDEPTTALDVTLQKRIIGLLQRLCADRGMALLFVSHDLAVVSELCQSISVMYAGKFMESGPTAEVISDPRHLYTWALLRSLPSVDGPRLPPLPIGGPTPDRMSPPTGCRFHPRCPVSETICTTGPIGLRDIGGGRQSGCIHGDLPLTVAEPRGEVAS